MKDNLELEEWGPRKQWVLNDRDSEKCCICGRLETHGYYCPIADRFWCFECDKSCTPDRPGCGCPVPFMSEHETWKVLCRQDTEKSG